MTLIFWFCFISHFSAMTLSNPGPLPRTSCRTRAQRASRKHTANDSSEEARVSVDEADLNHQNRESHTKSHKSQKRNKTNVKA